MKDHECPNCGSTNPEIISEGEFRCKSCNTIFYNESMLQQKRATAKKAANAKAQEIRQRLKLEHTRTINRMSKRTLFFVFIMLIIIFSFVGYMAKKSMDQSTKAQEEILKSIQNQVNNSQYGQ